MFLDKKHLFRQNEQKKYLRQYNPLEHLKIFYELFDVSQTVN